MTVCLIFVIESMAINQWCPECRIVRSISAQDPFAFSIRTPHRCRCFSRVKTAMQNKAEFNKELAAILNADSKVAINKVFGECLSCLKEHHVSYVLEKVAPQMFFTHPKNRGGLGLSWHNVHRNGQRVYDIGARKDKLVDSLAFEMQQGEGRAAQTEFNEELIRKSDGLLAQPSGNERYMTVGGGHTTAFCKAAKAGCRTSQTGIADQDGKLNLHKLCKDSVLEEMINDGWTWTIIPGVLFFSTCCYEIPPIIH